MIKHLFCFPFFLAKDIVKKLFLFVASIFFVSLHKHLKGLPHDRDNGYITDNDGGLGLLFAIFAFSLFVIALLAITNKWSWFLICKYFCILNSISISNLITSSVMDSWEEYILAHKKQEQAEKKSEVGVLRF